MLKSIELVGKLAFSFSVGCAGAYVILLGAPLVGVVLIVSGVVSAFTVVADADKASADRALARAEELLSADLRVPTTGEPTTCAEWHDRRNRLHALIVLAGAFDEEHDWTVDSDPDSTCDLLAEVRSLHAELVAQLGEPPASERVSDQEELPL